MNIRSFYTFLWHVAPCFIRRYLKKRGLKNPAYLKHWGERFGERFDQPVQNAIWVHAVSVGETRAAEPLLNILRTHFPELPILMTQMTPTGRETAQKLFPDAQCRYLPYDKPAYIRQFLQEHKPRFGILMETEIWPNLMHGCQEAGVPLFLANARLSEKSQRGYLRIRSLVAPAMQTLSGCYAQTATDAERLHLIGASNVHVCGNSKYDITPPSEAQKTAAQFKAIIGERAVVVCGSTRVYKEQNETEMLLKAWQAYRGNALLVIVPRHPERFDEAYQTACALGFKTQKRSDNQPVAPDTQVWIGDSMGEMFTYYLSADIAFVGGSLVDAGCQNIIEPIACKVPTLFGASIYNFADACRGAEAAGAAKQIFSAQEWYAVTNRWLNDVAERAGYTAAAEHFIGQHRGASRKMADLIAESIKGRL
ncbi:MAG: lipid IV(A) 3-deoxy-D-manno-octulosonic acid transferase [Neisseria sp.]|uniref:lipid IV(A) 3-deoxy-D-manno-octulosonic acid transferase n=1 Tax=Neisseria sp. TaxID=192066 RepID=UPI0026DCFBFC|nr:lipid IV(A) 3-deoxy-D-manno-octulosonic acid transferase [Neisseria sp.]MDO4641451.1 lipid IV(A) 3-deoxy-D-manno-octulosonic acid transferase [Neisseria sp.]